MKLYFKFHNYSPIYSFDVFDLKQITNTLDISVYGKFHVSDCSTAEFSVWLLNALGEKLLLSRFFCAKQKSCSKISLVIRTEWSGTQVKSQNITRCFNESMLITDLKLPTKLQCHRIILQVIE